MNFQVIRTFNVEKALVALDTCRTTIVYGGMESVIRLADYS